MGKWLMGRCVLDLIAEGLLEPVVLWVSFDMDWRPCKEEDGAEVPLAGLLLEMVGMEDVQVQYCFASNMWKDIGRACSHLCVEAGMD